MNEMKKNRKRRTVFGLLRIILKEIKNQRKWVLLPVWIFLAVMALVLVFAGSSYLLPAIYIAI